MTAANADEFWRVVGPVELVDTADLTALDWLDERFEFTGPERHAVAAALRDLENGRPRSRETAAAVAALRCCGLASMGAPFAVSGIEFHALLARAYRSWNERMFGKGLWTYLVNGTGSRDLVDGWLIETYHFIAGVNERLPYAIAFCHDPAIQARLRRHYAEEFDHYRFFSEALRLRGRDLDSIAARAPLASTDAVAHWMRAAARRGPLHYISCSGLLESSGSDTPRAREFYERVARTNDGGRTGFVVPLMRHVELDSEYAHGSISRDVFAAIPTITSEEAASILDCALGLVETLEFWFDDIVAHYGMPGSVERDPVADYAANPGGFAR